MQYGNKSIKQEKLYLYQGFDPASIKLPPNKIDFDAPLGVVNQRDSELHSLWQMVGPSVSLFVLLFAHQRSFV